MISINMIFKAFPGLEPTSTILTRITEYPGKVDTLYVVVYNGPRSEGLEAESASVRPVHVLRV